MTSPRHLSPAAKRQRVLDAMLKLARGEVTATEVKDAARDLNAATRKLRQRAKGAKG